MMANNNNPDSALDLASLLKCTVGKDDVDDILSKLGSKYMSVDKLNDFFKSGKMSAMDIIHINCRSMDKNFDEVLCLYSTISAKLTAIAVTETWLSVDTQDFYYISGYKFTSNLRCDKSGGGVEMFVRDKFDYTVCLDLSCSCSFIECVFVTIDVPQKRKFKLIVGCIYRPPSADKNLFIAEITNILQKIESEKSCMVVLAGDYNCNLFK